MTIVTRKEEKISVACSTGADNGLHKMASTQVAHSLQRMLQPWRHQGPVVYRCATGLAIQEGGKALMANPDSRKLLMKCLEDVYALEAHMVQTLGDHAKDARD